MELVDLEETARYKMKKNSNHYPAVFINNILLIFDECRETEEEYRFYRFGQLVSVAVKDMIDEIDYEVVKEVMNDS